MTTLFLSTQGQEVRVVVASTVLTDWVDRFEHKGVFGLMDDSRHFNVAVTRGMALCVVVGQPYVLHSDPCWRGLVEHRNQKGVGGWVGGGLSRGLSYPQ